MNLLDRIRQRKLNEQVYEVLESRFRIVDLDDAAYENALKERSERMEAAGPEPDRAQEPEAAPQPAQGDSES